MAGGSRESRKGLYIRRTEYQVSLARLVLINMATVDHSAKVLSRYFYDSMDIGILVP
jgi:hypothetical protein